MPFSSQNLIYVANDIVSLSDTDNIRCFSNTKYLKKILNNNELPYLKHVLIEDFIAPLLWSCKECSYKILLQKNYKKGFAPSMHEVELMIITKQTGKFLFKVYSKVKFEKHITFCISDIYNKHIVSLGCNKKKSLNNIFFATKKTSSDEYVKQSKKAYIMLMENIALHYKISKSQFEIIKDKDGKPSLLNNNLPLNIPFSISHDGYYISCAFLKK